MLDSTKIKFLGVVGTFVIITTAYALHAKTFYNEMYPTIEKEKTLLKHTAPVKEQFIVEEPKVVNVDKPKIDIEPIEIVTIEEIEKHTVVHTPVVETKQVVVTSSEKLDKIFKEYKYLYVEKSGKISQHSKEVLEKILPLLADINNSYIELEGHSASSAQSKSTQKISEKYAQSIYKYLNEKKIDKEIIVTGYGDSYPILDDKSDKQNSRVELKIRRR